MKVERFTAWHVVIPLKRTVRHASHARRSTDNFVVKCELADGTIGWGESVPRSYVTGETIDSVFDLFSACDLSEAFAGTIESTAAIIDRIKNWHPISNFNGKRDCFGNCLKCAVELSLLDAIGSATGESLSSIIESIPESSAILKRSQKVRYSTAVTTMKPAKQVIQSLLMKAWGFRQMKVKVGAADVDDVAMLKRIRRVSGTGIDLRLDANEAWRPIDVEQNMQPLIPFEISSLEQPVAHEKVRELKEVRDRLSVPIMLDESLCSIGDARRAIEDGTCDLFNIRISKCGGIINSLQLASIAQKAGLGYQLGCQVGESGILSAAGRHVACSIGGIRFLEGSFDKYLVKERLTKADLTFGYGGVASRLEGSGLGIEVDQTAVERIAKRTAQVVVS